MTNLPEMLAVGALVADSLVSDQLQCEVGDLGIKHTRRSLHVTCGARGHPCDYVPFYFAPKSPMLYKIAVGGVPHYQDGQDPLVYLSSTIGAVVDAGLPWVFSDGNCGAQLTEYFEDLAELDAAVDWPLQAAKMWNSTAEDPTRATRRAAEFLVHQRLPWPLVRQLVVRNETTASLVRAYLTAAGHQQPVIVRPTWYYQGAKFS
ncbi:DUF4433 domain-containing protein [Pseudonocardia sp. KRD-291]|nr:DUF4433 domain-containing protein [Pseudonocardia sp. KRD291]